MQNDFIICPMPYAIAIGQIIRKLPGERDNARNNARCTQARKTTTYFFIDVFIFDLTSSSRLTLGF